MISLESFVYMLKKKIGAFFDLEKSNALLKQMEKENVIA